MPSALSLASLIASAACASSSAACGKAPTELPSGSRKLTFETSRDGGPFDRVAVEGGDAVSLHRGAHMARGLEQGLEARRDPVEGEEMAQKSQR